jgi:hypothetical protein
MIKMMAAAKRKIEIIKETALTPPSACDHSKEEFSVK